jgi:hypothetical protein
VPTAGSGYTLVDLTDEDWWNTSEKLTSFDATPAGSKTVNFTNANAAYALSAIALKPSAGGGAAAIRLLFPYGLDGTGGGVTGQNRIH